MVKSLDPETSTSAQTQDTEVKDSQVTKPEWYTSTFRRTGRRHVKERVEAGEIIKSLTDRDQELAVIALKRLLAWHLALLANFALLILLLWGLGILSLPTALMMAVLGPVLSGVLGLLGMLVKHLTK